MLFACIQMNSSADMTANLNVAEAQVREAAANGAKLVAMPENAVLMTAGAPEYFTEAEHPAVGFFSKLAAELGLWLLLGSVAVKDTRSVDRASPEQSLCASQETSTGEIKRLRSVDRVSAIAQRATAEGSPKLKNRSILFAPDGRISGRYDKIHLFDVDIGSADSSGGAYRESDRISAGDKIVVADTPLGMLGLSVCYDMRFPALYRAMARAGAEILFVPAAFTRVTGEAHWHVLLRARAIETGCYVMAPAQCGNHPGNRQTFGHSLIINPWGKIIAEAGDEPCVIYADIDRGQVRDARRKIPAWKYD